MQWNGSDSMKRKVRSLLRNITKRVKRPDLVSNRQRQNDRVLTRPRLVTEKRAIHGTIETREIIEEIIVSTYYSRLLIINYVMVYCITCILVIKIKTEDATLLGVVLIWEVGEERDRKEVDI